MPNVERTALSAFQLNGMPVRKGQRVSLNELQLARLVEAGCVYNETSKDAYVPQDTVPVSQATAAPISAELADARAAEARQVADLEISEITARLDQQKSALATAFETYQAELQKKMDDATTASVNALQALDDEVASARKAADDKIKAIGDEVDNARKDADSKILATAAEVEAAFKAKAADAGEASDKTTKTKGA